MLAPLIALFKLIPNTAWLGLGILVVFWGYGAHMKRQGAAETKAVYERAAEKLKADQLKASNEIQQAAAQREAEAQRVIEQLRQEIDNVKKLAAQEAGAKNVCLSDAATKRLREIGRTKRPVVRPSAAAPSTRAP